MKSFNSVRDQNEKELNSKILQQDLDMTNFKNEKLLAEKELETVQKKYQI